MPAFTQNIANCGSFCTGNLGDNIFPDGDFGSGLPNIVQTNPGIAPGYGYQLIPPPNDGFYCITNNTSNWGGFAQSNWIKLLDNGPEVNGYMMVVNAAFAPGLFYQKTVPVCANTLYEMSVDLISVVQPNQASSHIQSNVAFLINGQDVCATGNIPHDATWRTYRFSFTTAPTDNQITLSFRNNAPGGYGNDIAIDNISFRACGPRLITPDTIPFCEGKPLNLSVDVSNSPYQTPFFQWQQYSSGQWNDIPGATNLNQPVSNPADGQAYRVVVASSAANLALPNCRAVSFPIQAALEDLSQFAIGGTDTIVCNGAPGTLEAGNYAAYQWSTGANSSTLSVGQPGAYAVTITTVNGCTATDVLEVYRVELSAEAEGEDPVCFGDSTGWVRVFNRQGGVGPLSYALQNGLPQAAPLLENLPSGNYTIVVKDSLGCTLRLPLRLSDPPQVLVSLGPDRQILACDTVQLQALVNAPNLRFEWMPADSLSCADCPDPVAMPLFDLPVWVRATSLEGCIAEDSLLIKVAPRLDVYAPNIFRPDDSGGENSVFSIFTGKSATAILRFRIYDRWGGLLFEVKNALPNSRELEWSGRDRRERNLPSGVYIWMAEIVFSDGVPRVFEGDVTLLR